MESNQSLKAQVDRATKLARIGQIQATNRSLEEEREMKNSSDEERPSSGVTTETLRPALDGTWYCISPHLNRIEAVAVEKATESFVVIDGRRKARVTEYGYYEPSLDAAKARLIDHHELLVSQAASMLGVRERDLERARSPRIRLVVPERDAETTTAR